MLQAFQNSTQVSMYPVQIEKIAPEITQNLFPTSPLTTIKGEKFSNDFEGMLMRKNSTPEEWAIIYNTEKKSSGRINFTLAHEFGHFLLHRNELKNGKIECNSNDVIERDSEYNKRETEANTFASYLLMPRNLFEEQLKNKELNLILLQNVANYFQVSLTAAILKFLEITPKKAMLVIGKQGFIDWVWSSKSLRESGIFLQPKREIIELPACSLATIQDSSFNNLKGIIHPPQVWPFKRFKGRIREMTRLADSYEKTISLLLFLD